MADEKYMIAVLPPSGKGRPRLIISEEGKQLITMLSGYMCTDEEIAYEMGTTVDTLHNSRNNEVFSECKKKGLAHGKASLRRKQFKMAERSAAMAIFLGKQYLNQKDDPTPASNDDGALHIHYDYGDEEGGE